MKIRFRFIDLVVSLLILAGSIMTFANVHYEKGLGITASILLFIFNYMFFFVVYQGLLLFWDKYVKKRLTNIVNYFTNGKVDAWKAARRVKKAEENLELEAAKTLDTQFRYVMHYLGNHIKADEQMNLKENFRLMAYEDKIEAGKTPFKPVCDASLIEFDQKDINHLGHAIGYHTLQHRKGIEIATFLKYSFPKKYVDCELTTIAQKLASNDYSNIRIPLEDKQHPLPFYDL